MKINSYSFGRMEIDGETVTDDLMVCGEELKIGWWRKEGHNLRPEDLEWVTKREPSFLVIGTGKSGLMSVPRKTKSFLEREGIDFLALPTGEAMDKFNEKTEEEDLKLAGAFHLTC